MTEEKEDSKFKSLSPDPPKYSHPFVEVICKSSGKKRRFAAGTEAGFAVDLINRKLNGGLTPLALHIEAVKEGEESIAFGPNSVLVDYGQGWILETVTQVLQGPTKKESSDMEKCRPPVVELTSLDSMKSFPPPVVGFAYIAKILVAIVSMFVLGAIFTLALENLPALILYMNW